MHCFIGGSGSTGSSLLASVINRHSDFYCGPETYLFTKHQLFEDWENAKNQILGGKLKSYAWHMYSKVDLEPEEFSWSQQKLKELIHYSNSISEFSDEFFKAPSTINGANYWAEKTPSNVFQFQSLVETFSDSFLIHTIRNPYDTVASLNRRGFNIYYACSLYLLNTSIGLASRKMQNYYQLIYEEFVTRPEIVIRDLCEYLDVPYERNMITAGNDGDRATLQSWGQNVNAEISPDSIGSFSKCSRMVQESIVYTLNNIAISPFYRKKYNIEFGTIEEICDHLGFTYYEDEGYFNYFQLQIDKARDHLSRIIKAYPSRYSKYPIIFKV